MPNTYLHLRASMSLPGDSRHRRIMVVCCRTTDKASSSNRAWSSTTGGGDAILLNLWLLPGRPNSHTHLSGPEESTVMCARKL